jgi:HK97 family phage major capsid protein
MTVTYDQLKTLTDAVNTLSKKLDERVTAVESWQAKSEQKVSQGGTIPAEGQPQLDTINKELSEKIAEYKALIAEQKEQRLAEQRPSYFAGEHAGETKAIQRKTTNAFIKYCRYKGDINRLNMDERKLIDPSYMDKSGMPDELKTMVSAVAELGGFFAGTDFSSRFIQKLFLVSPMRALCDVVTIGGEKLVLPSEGTTDTTVTWSDEQSSFSESTNPTLGMIEVYARELKGMQKINNQNLEDSVFDIEGFMLKRLTRQFAQKEGTAFLTGDGVNRPEGVLTNTSINSFTSLNASLITPDDIVKVMHTGKSGYRATSTWLMANQTIGVCRLFKDSQNNPIWQMFGDNFKETLFGRPIIEMPDMTEPATGTVTYTTGDKPILFGDFSQGYQIVDRVGLAFQTLKELYAVQNETAFLARMRVGGKVVLPEAITKLVIQ